MYQGRQLSSAEIGAIISGVLDLLIGTAGIFYPDPKVQQELLLISGVLTAVLAAFGIIVATRSNAKTNEVRMREIAREVASQTAVDRGLSDPKPAPPIDENPAEWIAFARALGWKGGTEENGYSQAALAQSARTFVLGKYRMLDRKPSSD